MAVTTGTDEIQVASTNGKPRPELETFNPATGKRVGSVPTITPEQVQSVVDEVAEVQPFWAQLSLAERGRYMKRTAQVILDHMDEITELITAEQGKPRLEAHTMEMIPTIDTLHWVAGAGQQILADESIPQTNLLMKMKKSKFVYEPYGVVGVIAPWNYPISIAFRSLAAAIVSNITYSSFFSNLHSVLEIA